MGERNDKQKDGISSNADNQTPLEIIREMIREEPDMPAENTRFVIPSAYKYVPSENAISSQPLTSDKGQD